MKAIITVQVWKWGVSPAREHNESQRAGMMVGKLPNDMYVSENLFLECCGPTAEALCADATNLLADKAALMPYAELRVVAMTMIG